MERLGRYAGLRRPRGRALCRAAAGRRGPRRGRARGAAPGTPSPAGLQMTNPTGRLAEWLRNVSETLRDYEKCDCQTCQTSQAGRNV